MGIAAGIDKAIAVIAPQAALKRTVARQKMQILDSGYGNYGASVTKKSLAGWLHAGGSSREDIEDNVSVLRQRTVIYTWACRWQTGQSKPCAPTLLDVGCG